MKVDLLTCASCGVSSPYHYFRPSLRSTEKPICLACDDYVHDHKQQGLPVEYKQRVCISCAKGFISKNGARTCYRCGIRNKKSKEYVA